MWGTAMVRGRAAAVGGAVWRRPAVPCASAPRPPALLAARRLSSSGAEAEWSVSLSDRAARRIHAASPDSPLLRLGVESGGCSGFSYKFEIDAVVATDKDRVFERDGARLVVDKLSLEYVKGATVDFTVEMIGETFEVKDNPNSDGECGCGVSFTPT